jgi:hypothetical protein
VAPLVALVRAFGRPVRLRILAPDHGYDPDGTLNCRRTELYVPNEHRANPLLFDFVLKWALRGPRTGQGFAAGIFMERALPVVRSDL